MTTLDAPRALPPPPQLSFRDWVIAGEFVFMLLLAIGIRHGQLVDSSTCDSTRTHTAEFAAYQEGFARAESALAVTSASSAERAQHALLARNALGYERVQLAAFNGACGAPPSPAPDFTSAAVEEVRP